jgi:hypothetical protein
MDDRYAEGSWSCAYEVAPVEQPPSLKEMLDIVREVEGH